MKKIITLALLLIYQFSWSQTQFWSDTFEDVGAPSSGARTPSQNFSCGIPATGYFFRTNTAGINLQTGTYSGFEGSKFWAGEDIDVGPTCVGGSISAAQNVTWSGINISGRTGLSFRGLLAAQGSLGGTWETVSFGANQDYVVVEYQIDGGGFVKGLAFYGNASSGNTTTLNQDTNNDLVGDGTALGYGFQEFIFNIPTTGTTLDLRVSFFANGSASEEIAVDNFRLFEAPACSNPVITTQPSNTSVCNNGNTTFTLAATGATSYQWQVNCGSGFTNVTNGGVYSGATTATLTITGATAGMNGCIYRCLAQQSPCSTTSSNATLTVSNPSLTPLTQTNVACFGGSNGAASVNPAGGGVSPYTYNWTPGNPAGDGTVSVTGLIAGTWTCTVTDNIGCTATQTFNITSPTAIVVTPASQTNVACFGGSNGAASINTPTGGAGGYSYNWTPGNPAGDGTVSVTGLIAGTWTCTVTDANSCTATRTFNITQPPAIVVTPASQTNVACFGGNTGAASINTPTGGAGGYTYNWTPGNPTGDGTVSVTGLTAGTWTCTVTDANSCTATQTFNITQPPAISVTPASQTNVACFGGSTGAASINTPTGGAGGYTYNWTPGNPTGDGTVSVTGLIAGTWTCTVTDANGCTATQTFNITQPPAISVTPASQTNVACFGGSTGAASINTPTGGAGGYTYNWTPGNPTGDGTVSVTGLIAGTWTCTVTDANGCTATQTFNITQPPAISVTPASQTNVACFGGSTGAASINTPTGGAGGYSYNWTPGNPTGDGTVSVTGLIAGTWTCTVTDANGCTATQTFNITQPPAISVTPASQTNVACFGGSTGAASINTPTGGAGGYSYNWTPGNPTGDGTVSVTGLTAGTWTCTVTDANSCTATQTFNITQPSAISANISSTSTACTSNTGTATVSSVAGGAGGYTYSWAPTGGTAATATGLAAGNYTCTITDANLCSITRTVTVTTTAGPTLTAASQTNISCNGGNNGAASVNAATGGTGPYTYNWTPGNPTGDGTVSVTGLTAGSWTCTVTDAAGCIASQTFNITQPSAITVTAASQTNVSCFGGNNGAASINTPTGGAGGYSYNWTPGNPTGDGTVSVTGLVAGTWTCTVTDANGCTATQTFNITQPPALVLNAASQTNVSCFGGTNGAASVTAATGGAGGYSYNWTPGNPAGDGTVSVTGLVAGTWTCTVTDANGCQATRTFNITQPPALLITAASQTNIACNGGSNGAASVNAATGGSGGYTYNWTPGNPTGDGTVSVTGLTAGSWTCTVTDANGCQATQTFNITQPAVITANISSTSTACTSNTGTATVSSVAGGAGGYTYSWAPTGGTAATATGLAAGNYTCTITDANTCSITRTVTVTTASGPALTAASQTNISCNGGSNGAASVNAATGGTGPYTYNWTPGNPTGDGTVSVTGLTAGTWTCTVTDANGCTATQTFNITQPSALVLNAASQTNVSCFGGNNGAASVTAATGGAGGYSYNWTPGNPTGDGTVSVTGLTAGTWTCTVTDANGCQATRTFNITQPTPISATPTLLTNVNCNGGNNGAISLSVTGGAGGYTYNWTPGNPTGDGTASVTGLTAGSWTCTITDANGCILAPSFTITQPSAVVVTATATPSVICQGNSSLLSASASGGSSPYSYNWQPGNLSGPSHSVTPSTTTTYTVTTTDASGCTGTRTVQVTVNPRPVVIISGNSSFCAGGSTLLTGSTGGTSQWYRNGVIIPGATSNTYTATLAGVYNLMKTNLNGCSDSAAVGITVTINALPVVTSVSSISPLCNGNSNGSATVTATGAATLSYSWAPAGGNLATASGIGAGTYTCTITDGNGCTFAQTVTVTQPAQLVATITSSTTPLCNGDSTATATVAASGGSGSYTYNWSSGGNAATETGLPAGSYVCTVTDSNGCVTTATATISQPATLATSISSQTDVSCFGLSNGAASVSVTGGTGTPAFIWQPGGDTTSSVSGLSAGTYVVTVTDANGCSTQQTVTITQPPALGLSVSSNPAVLCAGDTAVLSASVASTTIAPVIDWMPVMQSGSSISVAPAVTSSYTITVTDSAGCSETTLFTLTVAPQPVFTLGSDSSYCSSSAPVTISGPAGAWMYSWQDSTTTQNYAVTSTGTYVLTVTDSSGTCGSTDSVSIIINASPVISFNDTTACATSLTLCGPAGNYLYTWSTGSTTQCIVYAAQSDTLVLTVLDSANGCSTTDTVAVTLLTPPVLSFSVPQFICVDDAPIGLLATPAGGLFSGPGVSGTTFDPGASSTGMQGINYFYMDANGCTATATDSIFVDPCLNVSGTDNSFAIQAYPNPASETLIVETTENGQLEIVNELGQVVMRQQIVATRTQLDVNRFNTGLYVIRYQTLSGKTTNIRFMVNH
jgi:hypothetical protein